jgi:hypothetical protein
MSNSTHFTHNFFCLEHNNACNRKLPLWKTHHLPPQTLEPIDACRNIHKVIIRPRTLENGRAIIYGHFTIYNKPLTTKTPTPTLPLRSRL